MPTNFISSFVRNQTNKGQNLPSSVFKPKYDHRYNIYEGINYNKNNFSKEASVFERKHYKFNFMTEIKIEGASGIPIPDKNEVLRENLKYRKIYCCLYNKKLSQYIGNSIEIEAKWNPELED